MLKLFSIFLITSVAACSSLKNLSTIEPRGAAITMNGQYVSANHGEITITTDYINFEWDSWPVNPEKKEWYSAKIAVTDDPANLIYFKEGPVEGNPYFGPATGMAVARNSTYDCLYLQNFGNHYLYYESEHDFRATKLNAIEGKNGEIRLIWETDCLSIDGEQYPITQAGIDQIYVMIFVDNNLNDIVEEDEYKVFTVTIETE